MQDLINKFEVHIVGGYVRDRLMNLNPKDHDYVVVGATPDDMLHLGFSQVAQSFPVFIHPQTGDEYALARTERKVGRGYNGFEVDFDPTITLIEDLHRRDLTMNSMARKVVDFNDKGQAILDDNIIDPYNGQEDIQRRIIRATSTAFAEDPIRVLRVARFVARYGFDIEHDTLEMMKALVEAGELSHLVPERIWIESDKAMSETNANMYWSTLIRCNAYEAVFGDIPSYWLSLHLLEDNNDSNIVKWSVLPTHLTPDERSAFFQHMKAPNRETLTATNVSQMYVLVSNMEVGNTTLSDTGMSSIILTTLKRANAFRQRGDFIDVVIPSLLLLGITPDILNRVVECLDHASTVGFAHLSSDDQNNLQGVDISNALDRIRIQKIDGVLQQYI